MAKQNKYFTMVLPFSQCECASIEPTTESGQQLTALRTKDGDLAFVH
jgi:hypothetical protein